MIKDMIYRPLKFTLPFVIILVFFAVSHASASDKSPQEELAEIRAKIAEQNLHWTADLNPLVLELTPEERQQAIDTVASEIEVTAGEEFDRLVRISLIKELRSKYQIPYVSPFYY